MHVRGTQGASYHEGSTFCTLGHKLGDTVAWFAYFPTDRSQPMYIMGLFSRFVWIYIRLVWGEIAGRNCFLKCRDNSVSHICSRSTQARGLWKISHLHDVITHLLQLKSALMELLA